MNSSNTQPAQYVAPFMLMALAACGGGGSDTASSASTSSSATAPSAPTITAATAGNASASIAFSAPASNGGATITAYTASCAAAGVASTAAGASSPLTVSGLTNGTAYTCAVSATNSAGAGVASASVSVTPLASAPATVSLAAGYKQAKWASNVSVTYPSECSMTITTDGQPNHAIDTYYLEPPIGSYTTVVAHASQSGMALVVVPYSVGAGGPPVSFNICPTKAATTTATGGGGIGLMISGPALFNATEGENGKAAALSDNVSYSFTDPGGAARTARFIDSCNGHPTPNLSGNTYHYHGLSSCITSQVDSVGGASHLIGVAADGFPIYGGRDLGGKVITLAQLDECNGITSATPEFPNGVYHYVLPEGVTNFQSSLRCYAGTAPLKPLAALKAAGVCAVPRTAFAAAWLRPDAQTSSAAANRLLLKL